MRFDLVRPCPHCPFRTDRPGFLRGARAQEIAQQLAEGAPFACHQTTVGDEEGADLVATADSQMCAGALLVMEAEEQPNQSMRLAERYGKYDPEQLDRDAPVARSLTAFIEHHAELDEEIEPCSVCDPQCLAPAGYGVGGSVITNVSIDPEDLHECSGCGQPVCEACATDSGRCPSCEEWAAAS